MDVINAATSQHAAAGKAGSPASTLTTHVPYITLLFKSHGRLLAFHHTSDLKINQRLNRSQS